MAHVFPPDRIPYPDGDVLARWRLTDAALSAIAATGCSRARLWVLADNRRAL